MLHSQASDLVKCVVSTTAPVRAIANLESESETKKYCVFKSSFNARYNSGSLMPAINSIMYIYIWGGRSQFLNLRIHTYLQNHGKDNRGNKRRWHIFRQKPTWISCVNQSKINTTQLSRRNNVFTQPRRPFRDLHAPWVLSTAGKLLIGYNLSVFWDSVKHCGQKRFSKIA